jgi:hypothetical protein
LEERNLRAVLSSLLLSVTVLGVQFTDAQEIPKGVRYKLAADELNNAAESALTRALANNEVVPEIMFDEVTVCGPMLWKSLKPGADRVLLDAKPLISMIQSPEPVVAEGKRIITHMERVAFWQILFAKFPSLKGAKVRKAKADEITYYWATIPFDIEEPFFAIDTGSDRFIADFTVKSGRPRLFWLDRVDDLRLLKQ